MDLTPANRIWNRAALQRGGETPRDGDIALVSLPQFHGLAMNGGIGHAVEVLTPDELHAGVRGYQYFGLDVVARIIARALTADDNQTDTLDRDYGELVRDDATLVAASKSTWSPALSRFRRWARDPMTATGRKPPPVRMIAGRRAHR